MKSEKWTPLLCTNRCSFYALCPKKCHVKLFWYKTIVWFSLKNYTVYIRNIHVTAVVIHIYINYSTWGFIFTFEVDIETNWKVNIHVFHNSNWHPTKLKLWQQLKHLYSYILFALVFINLIHFFLHFLFIRLCYLELQSDLWKCLFSSDV